MKKYLQYYKRKVSLMTTETKTIKEETFEKRMKYKLKMKKYTEG